MSIRDDFYKLMDQYGEIFSSVSQSQDFKHPFGNFIRHEIPTSINKLKLLSDNYKIKGGCGAGRWTSVPWIAIFDKRITESAQKGVYIVYLLNKDSKELFLTLNQGATDVSQDGLNEDGKLVFTGIAASSNSQTIEKLRQKAIAIRNKIQLDNKVSTSDIKTGSAAYDAGCICSIKYTLSNLPDDKQLYSDLETILQLYKKYYNIFYGKDTVLSQENEQDDSNKEGEEIVTVSKLIKKIKEYIAASGFTYPDGMIENFWLSLKSKPFVILAGTSGTGKTRLVRLFAEAISAEYQLVAVRPDWSDSSDLFGHVDLNGNFIPGAVLDFMNKAKANPEKPYILCLDEMNLARVEYYLSDLLSIMETREVNGGTITSDPILNESYYGKTDIAAREKYGVQRIPENFYLVGTVNMDETTFPFSRKVLDRANTIEFSYVDLDNPEFGGSIKPEPEILPNSFLKTEYLFLKQCIAEENYVKTVCSDLQRINGILQKAEAHVGYRVRDEIVFYMINNKKAGLLTEKEAFDNEIMQKILPRIQGSSASVKKLLCSLFAECAGSYSDSNDSDSKNMEKYIEEKRSTLPYPKSAEKIMFMTRRFEEDGFTSYWL